MNVWWSWGLAVVGAGGYLLVVRGSVWGLVVGALLQVAWFVYAVVTGQWGFLVSASLFLAVNLFGLRSWWRARDSA